MAKRTVYFDNCIKEIRESVYGRDNRKPIADSIEELETLVNNGSVIISLMPFAYVDADLIDESITDWIEFVPGTVYPNYLADSADTTDLTVTLITKEDWLATDNRTEDTVQLISGENYLFKIGNSEWALTSLTDESYTTYSTVQHKENYEMLIDP